MDEPEAIAIATQLCRALAVAHEAGIVHRELRPSVVFVDGRGDKVHVKVTDLVLKRSPIAGDPEAVYLAPEHGRPGASVGRRADVFSVGAMLHSMLHGAPPRGAEVALRGPLGDVARRCVAEDPRERFLDAVALDAALRAAITPHEPTRPKAGVASSRPEREPAPEPEAQPPASIRPRAPSLPPSSGASSPPIASKSASARPAPRAPAAPPPRPLGRPLTARPRWEDTLLDFADGPVPRVAIGLAVGFAIVRLFVSGVLPFVAAALAGALAYATWRRARGPGSP